MSPGFYGCSPLMRRSILLWMFAGTSAGAGLGGSLGLILGGIVAFGTAAAPRSDLVATTLVLTLYGAFIGLWPGLLGGVLLALLDRLSVGREARAVAAAVVGLGVGALFGIYYPPLLLLTGPLGLLGGWAAATLVTGLRGD